MNGTAKTPAKRPWPGIASFSQSVLCLKEPNNTKAVFGRVAARALELLTAKLGEVRFVQVGANDGVHADHIHPFVTGGKWRGVLVEPAPVPFARLTENYRGVDGLCFVQAAVATRAGQQPFYYVEGEDGLSSFSLETIMSHAPKYDDLPSMIRTLEVETETLDALCDREGFARPDVVVVDTEGTDDVVLLSFSIEERRPSLILFEHCHLSAERSAALRDRILAAGYRLIHDRHDALAIAEGTFDAATTDFLANIVAIARADPSER
ncbi:MAG: FkbM family methyltransferase [Pseudomonadota bacterium]|nr:FkbM family methyltransferase [Pseudomonadota bacterium]